MQSEKRNDGGHAEASDAPQDPTLDQQIAGKTTRKEITENQGAPAHKPPADAQAWRLPEKLSLVFDGLLVLVGIIGFPIVACQTCEMRQANDVARAALREAADANRLTRAAQAKADADGTAQQTRMVAQDARAKRQLDVAEETMRRSRDAAQMDARAWIVPDSASIANVAPGLRVEGHVILRNAGRSPAIAMSASPKMTFWRAPELPKYKFGLFAGHVISGSQILGSDHIVRTVSTLPRPLTENEIAELTGKTAHLLLYGEVTYRDVFGARHLTRYCFRNAPPVEGQPRVSPAGEWTVLACQSWNELR